MATARITIYVDRKTDRDEVEERDAKDVDLKPYGVELKSATSTLVIPWHRIREVTFQ